LVEVKPFSWLVQRIRRCTGFTTIAHIGQRAAYDHAHRVIEIAGLHLVDDVDPLELVFRRRGENQSRLYCRSRGGFLLIVEVSNGTRRNMQPRPENRRVSSGFSTHENALTNQGPVISEQ